ncbi:MAG: single-stranded-DNA-specific exonuclease RecJ, partial [Spirochaetaceae bacterium]|nr:single-stranded-DNA-specific exonuclease RecJ [Spirochaetaceae bacterium]
MIWNKKDISREQVRGMTMRYGCDDLTASILARRGIIRGADLLYFLEDDLRFQHSPFLFNQMENAVDRILQARDEGEKVLVFGDRDVDGITSTVLLVTHCRALGIDVDWRLPAGNEDYGLTMAVIDDFAAAYGTLLITVDCGISNAPEIAHAAELGIDVIVTDHHEPPEILPEGAVILDPKAPESGYPWTGISGCAVVYKLVSALRFAQSEFYNQEICLLNVRPLTEAYVIECLKVQNMTVKASLAETVVPGTVSLQNTRILPFLQGQRLLTWDAPLQKKQLEKIFGTAYDFQLLDFRREAEQLFPQAVAISLLKLKDNSRIARYKDEPATEIEGFFNFFVTCMLRKTGPAGTGQLTEFHDLQMVALAALADIMPLMNENRLFVRRALRSINQGQARPGLLELLARQNLLGKHISSVDLSWRITPPLNAPGRIGRPDLTVKLFLTADAQERTQIAQEIIQMNDARKQVESEVFPIADSAAFRNMLDYADKFAVVVDPRIDRGVTGSLANKLVKTFGVPAVVIANIDETRATGSVRSARGFDATALLSRFADILVHYGGHQAAAGFSILRKNLDAFTDRLKEIAPAVEFDAPEDEKIDVDAELRHSYMTPELIKTVDLLEPYGKDTRELRFVVRGVTIVDAKILGKTERTHLKLTFQCGEGKSAPK